MRRGEISAVEVEVVFLLTVIGKRLAGNLPASDAAAVREDGEEERVDVAALLQDVEDLLGTFVDEGNCADLNADHFFRLTWKGDRRDRQGGARACGELYKIAPIEVECVHGRILS